MKTTCIKTKINGDDLEGIRLWFKTLKSRIDETMETLENEGVKIESVFIDKQGSDFFLIHYMKADDINKAYEVFEKSNSPIDIYFKDCWKRYCKGRIILEELLDLERL